MRSSWQGSPRSISDILLRFPQRKCWFFSPHISRKTFSYSAQASGMPRGNIKAWPQAERTLAELISVSINDLAWSDLSSWLFFFFSPPLFPWAIFRKDAMRCPRCPLAQRSHLGKLLTWRIEVSWSNVRAENGRVWRQTPLEQVCRGSVVARRSHEWCGCLAGCRRSELCV